MPLIRVSLKRGKSPEYIRAILDGIYDATRATFNVPDNDRFMLVSQHDEGEFVYGSGFLGIERTDDLVIIQITAAGRTLAQKKALYQDIASRLSARPGLRPQDIFISLVGVQREDWSFGNGEAQLAPPEVPAA
jgi:phenylpyruvate tautomerase PptA (4-oxalocrotonate tautomerase family)